MKIFPERLIPRVRRAYRRMKYGALVAGFSAASTVITRIKNWVPSNRESNDLIFGDGEMLRARSRSLVRENPWACGGLDTFVANAIGTGIKPISLHPDPVIRKKIDKAFEVWTDEADAAGTCDFYGQQTQVCRAVLQDGEVFTRIRFRRPEDGLTVPLQLQDVEADFVPYTKEDSQSPGGYTRGGIRFDILGRRISYWMYRDHPGSGFVRDPNLYEIPADQVLHVYEVLRPGQLRGQPWLTPAIVMLYDIKQLLDATLMRAKIANLLSFWIKRGPSGAGVLNETDNGDGTAVSGVVPGSVNYLNEGEEVMAPTPPAFNGTNELLTDLLRAASRALRLTEQQFTGDMTGVNYSSARVARLEFYRTLFPYIHQVMVFQWCRRVRKAWMDQAALVGVIDAEDYVKNRADYLATAWEPQGQPWVDPESEVAALKSAVRSGFVSRRRVVAATGESLEQIDQENAEDNKRADGLDLAYDSDGRKADKGAEAVPVPAKPGAPAPAPAKSNGKGAQLQ